MKIILASTSPIRKKMLSDAKIEAKFVAPEVDEDIEKLKFEGTCLDLALHLSKLKALSVKEKGFYIIGCDQVCELEGEIIDKGGNHENSEIILHKLQGKTHLQNTAMTIAYNSEVVFQYSFVSKLHMKPLNSQQITDYLLKDKPYYCAGSYKLEENGHNLFSKIEGKHDCIQGLPLSELSFFIKNSKKFK